MTYHGIMGADYNRREYVSLEHVSDWTSYCTHHSNTDAPHYGLADEPSDYLCYWMFYYTHHINMDAPHYVYGYVPSDYFY